MSGYLGINYNPANIPKNKVSGNLKSIQGLLNVIQTYTCSRYGTQVVEMVKSIGDRMVEQYKDSIPGKLIDVRNESIQMINDIFDGTRKFGEQSGDGGDNTEEDNTEDINIYVEIDNYIAEITPDEKAQFKKALIQLFTVILTNSSVKKKLAGEKKADTYMDVDMFVKNMYDVVYSICPNTNPNNIKVSKTNPISKQPVKGKDSFGQMSNTNCLLIGLAVLGILFYFCKNKKGGNLFGKRRRR